MTACLVWSVNITWFLEHSLVWGGHLGSCRHICFLYVYFCNTGAASMADSLPLSKLYLYRFFILTSRQGPLNFLGKPCTLSLVQTGLELKMVPPYLSFLSSWYSNLCHTTQLSPTCFRSSRTLNAEVSNMTLDIREQMLTKAHSSPGVVLMRWTLQCGFSTLGGADGKRHSKRSFYGLRWSTFNYFPED